ncbi:hypothetical protein FO519_000610 [Halicephalobus sp. NKZ332]|nr:hypothetical protein FO519_000610 [Halicephalobus sp. NKZ332]
MYIISESENLLERLRLLIQSSPLGNDQPSLPGNGSANEFGEIEDPGTAVFIAVSMEERNICGPGEKIIVLAGKEWNQAVTGTIADVSRHIMSMDNDGRILVIKKDLSAGDQHELEVLVDRVHEEWCSEWNYQLEKIRNLGESAAKREAIEKMDKWISPVSPKYSIIDFDDPSLPQRIKEYCAIPNVMRIREWSSIEEQKPCSKPPALHWTNYPREAEIQVSFKFTFPQGTIFEKLFRKLIAESRNCRTWEYDYEWTNGILLREELIKITVVRSSPNIIEVSGRVDKDDVVDEYSTSPFRPVWPYLAKVLRGVISLIEDYPYLPYVLNIVFIGDIFFGNSKSTGNTLNARSLDGVQSLGALERVHTVRFKVGEIIYALDLKQAFPGFEPHIISDFWLLNANEPKSKELSLAQSPRITTDELPFSLGPRPSSQGSAGPVGSTHLNVNKSRGRRVSFGAIRAIPTPGISLTRTDSNGTFETPRETDSSEADSSFKTVRTSSPPPEVDNESTSPRATSPVSASSLSEYIDNIVQKTIDEVLVLE